MNKEELYDLSLSDICKYSLLNEIFAIRDERKIVKQLDYAICVNGYISLDVLNQYVNKIEENTNLKQALNEIREYINHWKVYECDKNTVRELSFESSKEDILQIIDKVLGDDRNEHFVKEDWCL